MTLVIVLSLEVGRAGMTFLAVLDGPASPTDPIFTNLAPLRISETRERLQRPATTPPHPTVFRSGLHRKYSP